MPALASCAANVEVHFDLCRFPYKHGSCALNKKLIVKFQVHILKMV